MEFFVRLASKSMNVKEMKNLIRLKHRKTGEEWDYRLVEQKSVYRSNFQMLYDFEEKTKLEVEFDYDTDDE